MGRKEREMIGLIIALSVYSGVVSLGVVAAAVTTAAKRRYRARHRFLED